MPTTNSIIVSVAVVSGSLLAANAISKVLGKSRRKQLPYPPGPPQKFLIGNALDFPAANLGPTLAEWSKKYDSGIIYANVPGTDMVVINDRAIAEELCEARAKLYSDRPPFPSLDILGWEHNFVFMNYDDAWRKHRRLSQQHFNPTAAREYLPITRERINHFLRGVLAEPEKVFDHNKMLSISLTLAMMYGYEPTSLNDPVIHIAEESVHLGVALLSPTRLFNIIPILRLIPPWIPGAIPQKTARRVKNLTADVKRIPREHIEKDMKEGTAAPSLVTSFLEKQATEGASEEESDVVNNVAWTVYGAASDTTITAMTSFLHLILIHPDVQRKAQAEIDQVVGNDRLPDTTDRESLPYVEAVYRELMRCRPPIPAGIPHALTEDDIYEGYFLPKGSLIIPNIWAMTHDERVYPGPDKFMPERFFDSDGKLNDDHRVLAYGFGRRVCVGQHIASSTMFMAIASFLACFDINPAKDEHGNEIEIDNDYVDHVGAYQKKPFKCSITPRNEHARRLIESTADR